MSEVKEMMIKLPMVTAASWNELTKARTYPQSGRYIVQLDNGDIVVADVTLPSVKDSEPQTNDEGTASACTCFVGQPELLNPDEWTLAVDLENAKLAHEAEMAEQKAKCEALCRETEENCKKLIDEKEAEISELKENNEQKLAMRRMELESEYEKKKMQLELDTPKRFAQGEWVSGKTLTEIIKTLAGKGKEDAGTN